MLNQNKILIKFDQGTIIVYSEDQEIFKELEWLRWDERSQSFRCHALKYRYLIRFLTQNELNHTDFTPEYSELTLGDTLDFQPFEYQAEALEKWSVFKKGVVVLPTGAGKSFLAVLAIHRVKRSTLVIVPTIDLMLQWQENIAKQLKVEIGLLGGGFYDIKDITVSTYDSARIHGGRIGNKFCFLVFDECHHLPSSGYAEMARSFIAPYRMGLSATISHLNERAPILSELTGPIVYEKKIGELAGDYLAEYEVNTLYVELNEDEKEMYDLHRGIYQDFKNKHFGAGRRFNWQSFIFVASQSNEGRSALKSFHIQKNLSVAASEKYNELAKIFIQHASERVLIFTNDNKTAYNISSLFFIPLITHQVKSKERKKILTNFKNGSWPFLVSSRVLNEGVDIPEASVAVIISGTSVVREHVQRLGRILRKKENKRAVLYELITKDTGEIYTHQKRRDHEAYQDIN